MKRGRSHLKNLTFPVIGLLLGCCLSGGSILGCGSREESGTAGATHPSREVSAPAIDAHRTSAPAASLSGATASSSSPAARSPSGAEAAQAEPPGRFGEQVVAFSEKGEEFFSDNLISNETSYLQVSDALRKDVKKGGVYVGVGPEQNFTYIADVEPKLAFIVDIRRDNMLLHLLYRAAFLESPSRAGFLALMLGRAPAEAEATTDDAEAVIARALQGERTEATFTQAHDVLMKRVSTFGVPLSEADRESMRKMHRVFYERQVALKFELKEKNGRAYPTLRELLVAKTPGGRPGGFLATEASFRAVSRLQHAGAIVPVVGDFSGKVALRKIGDHLKTIGAEVSVFYVSNVEQYLLEPKTWASWAENVRGLPKNPGSVFIRAYLDQGRTHPAQLKGHRTATVIGSMETFDATFGRAKTTTLWALTSPGSP